MTIVSRIVGAIVGVVIVLALLIVCDNLTKKPYPTQTITIENGTFQVGFDAPAGQYTGVVPIESEGCFLQISDSLSEDLNDVIFAASYVANSKIFIMVKDGQFITIDGCGKLYWRG